jgi:paraquat-inducible protein B
LSTSRGETEKAEKTVTTLENNARVKYGKFNVAITKLNRKLSDTHVAHRLKVAELEAELATSRGKTEEAKQSVASLNKELSKDHAAHLLKVAELEAELEAA